MCHHHETPKLQDEHVTTEEHEPQTAEVEPAGAEDLDAVEPQEELVHA